MTQRVTIGWWVQVCAACAVFGASTAGWAEPAPPVCRDEVCFAAETEIVGAPLTLRGVSTFRYWGLRVYTGALYLPAAETSPAAVLGETPKKLVLRYHRGVSVDQFVEKSEEVLEEHPRFSPEKIRPFLSRINALYVPVEKGDAYAITYDPTPGTLSLFFNERLLGQIHDRDFARAYFGIWVSDYSVSKRFTDELLGRK